MLANDIFTGGSDTVAGGNVVGGRALNFDVQLVRPVRDQLDFFHYVIHHDRDCDFIHAMRCIL